MGSLRQQTGFQVRQKGFPVIRMVIMTVIMTLGILAVLPISRALSKGLDRRMIVEISSASIPPPEPPPPEPPPPLEDEVEEEVDDLDQTPQELSLDQLEASLNPGMGDALTNSFNFDSFSVNTDLDQEIQLFSIADLDSRPKPLSQIPPIYPPEFETRGYEGMVKARIMIDEQGNVTVLEIVEATHPEAIQPVRQALVKWRFEPPKKNGHAVRATYTQPLSYNYR